MGSPQLASSTRLRSKSKRARPNILPFGDFEFIYIALDRAGIPAFGQPRVDCIPVVLEVAAEATQFWWTSLMHVSDPLVQLATAPFANHTQELLRQPPCTDQLNTPLKQLVQEHLVLLIKVRWSTQQ
jgi:hypothetical protein